MAYATAANVAELTGKDVGDISSFVLGLADREVDRVLGRTFGSVTTDDTEYFDIEDRNVFLRNDIGSRNFSLCKWPVTAVSKVEAIYREKDNANIVTENPSELRLDEDYFLDNLEQGCIVKISGDFNLPTNLHGLKVTFSWGFADVPDDIKDFADLLAAAFTDGIGSVPTNADGAPLEELEIGRYREKYANPKKVYVEGKYAMMLTGIRDACITKYKLWD